MGLCPHAHFPMPESESSINDSRKKLFVFELEETRRKKYIKFTLKKNISFSICNVANDGTQIIHSIIYIDSIFKISSRIPCFTNLTSDCIKYS